LCRLVILRQRTSPLHTQRACPRPSQPCSDAAAWRVLEPLSLAPRCRGCHPVVESRSAAAATDTVALSQWGASTGGLFGAPGARDCARQPPRHGPARCARWPAVRGARGTAAGAPAEGSVRRAGNSAASFCAAPRAHTRGIGAAQVLGVIQTPRFVPGAIVSPRPPPPLPCMPRRPSAGPR
jgi:hypothetical protein